MPRLRIEPGVLVACAHACLCAPRLQSAFSLRRSKGSQRTSLTFFQCMDLSNLSLSKDPFAEDDVLLEADLEKKKKKKKKDATAEDELGNENKNLVHIRVQQRNGRKCITTVQGLDSQLDLKKILKAIKKAECCNGSASARPPSRLSPLLCSLCNLSAQLWSKTTRWARSFSSRATSVMRLGSSCPRMVHCLLSSTAA